MLHVLLSNGDVDLFVLSSADASSESRSLEVAYCIRLSMFAYRIIAKSIQNGRYGKGL